MVGVACLATLTAGVGAAVARTTDGPGAADAGGDRAGNAASPAPRVAPLNRVVTPDALVVSPRTITAADAARFRRTAGVTEALRVAAGTVEVGSSEVSVLGVDPSKFRAWTPLASAKSDELWRALAHDQLVLTFQARDSTTSGLGRTYPVTGKRMLPLRLGGVAELDLPGIDGLVTGATARGLGLAGGTAMLVNAPSVKTSRLAEAVHRDLGSDARVVPMGSDQEPRRHRRGGDGDAGDSAADARSYRELYRLAAARCPGLSWAVLAAIGQVESGHGRNMGPSSAGALGPMQFMPATWRSFGVDGNGDGRRDIWDPYDAVPAAADYLCAHGAGDGGGSLRAAVFAYNHSDSYVRTVLATAEAYAGSG